MMPETPVSPSEKSSPLTLRRLRAWMWFACLHTFHLGHHTLRWIVRGVLLLYFLFAFLILSLRYFILPQVADYKPQVESMISRSLGRDVHMASLQANWKGINPELQLKDMVMHDSSGTPALNLPEVNVTLSWWSLAVLNLRFEKIEVLRPSLSIQRDEQGKIFVGSFYIDPQQKGDGKGLDWLLEQYQIAIRNGTVVWTDKLRGAQALVLSDVGFTLQNHWRRHQFALKATPPASLAAPLDVRGDFQHKAFSNRPSDFTAWSGDLYANLQNASLPAWAAYVEYPGKMNSANGAVRAWLHLDQGRIADFTADLRLRDVSGRFAPELPAIDMKEVSGRIIATEKQDIGKKYLPSLFGKSGHTLELQQLKMTGRDGQALPPMSIREDYTPATRQQPQQVSLLIGYVDLQVLAGLALHLPIPEDQRRMLADFAPSGQLKNFKASWTGEYPAIANYRLAGQFVNLSMQAQAARLASLKTASAPARAAVPAIPGFSNLSGAIDASDQGGSFSLDSQNLLLNMPGYFVDPAMPFSRLLMQANWRFDQGDMLVFQIGKMEVQQDSMRLTLSGRHAFAMKQDSKNPQPGQVDLNAHADGFDLKQLDRYIPLATPPELKHWLLSSILDGRADDVSLRLRGDLAAFPFSASDPRERNKGDKDKGEFIVKGKLTGARLDFTAGELAEGGKAPLWPVIEDINGNFVFERARMEINADTAKTFGADLRKVKAVIPDLLAHDPMLNIDGLASSALQQMLGYVGASPVDGWLSHFLAESKASGNANLNLKLQLPLNRMADAKVFGQLQFAGNDVVLQPGIPLVTGLNGKLEFNEHGVNLNTLKGNALGGALVVTGGSQKDGSIRVRLDGTASGNGLTDYLPEPARSQLAGKVSGAARYLTNITVRKQLPEISIESPLQGLALSLPAPLQKNANDLLPLRIDLQPKQAEGSVLQDELRIRLGNLLQARYQRQKPNEKNAAWQVVRGGIGMNVPAPEPDSGVQVHIEAPELNADEWQQLAQLSSAAVPAAGKNTADPAAIDLAPYLNAEMLTLKTGSLQIMGKRLDQVLLGMSHLRNSWHGNLDSRQMSGYIRWSERGTGQSGGNVTARFSRLSIPQSAASDVSDLLETKSSATQMPGLDIVAEQFELFNKSLGRLELQASNRNGLTGSEWHLEKVLLKNPDAELHASGLWTGKTNGNTRLDYVLDINNSGQLLDRLGFQNVLRGGRGKLEGSIGWKGLPISMDIPSMGGNIYMNIEAGQFLKVDPGAAKLLGVLSMQSLPRRLSLDFRDVFSEGFAFDAITGSAQIEKGIARTDNLKMRGVNATVLMSGTADIVQETQQLHVAVIPVVNAGAASVVYGLAVNPVIGVGTFLAQLFLREPLAKAFTFEYAVSGPWNDPVVRKIEHVAGQEASGETGAPARKGE